jgi:methylated-DNA-[protein]-cysteine S-methyltransferase
MNGATLRLDTPIGLLDLVAGPSGLFRLDFVDRDSRLPASASSSPALRAAAHSIEAYFAGDLRALERVEVDPQGTAFQRQVWHALRRIPAGRTLSYAELARSIDRPTAVRAVALCNARNPIALVVPCHRVIGSDGSLTGYGGGLERKRWLLEHEGALFALSR